MSTSVTGPLTVPVTVLVLFLAALAPGAGPAAAVHDPDAQEPATGEAADATGDGETTVNGKADDDGAAATSAYEPPARTRQVADDAPARPLLQAVRHAAAPMGNREWGRTTSQELGLSTFERFDERLFQNERLQLVVGGFREGYSQTFIQLPEAVFVTAIEMDTPEAARELYRLQMEVLQMTLDVQAQREDTTVEVAFEDDIPVHGLDGSFEKRYSFALEEQSPTRFRVLWGHAGRHAFEVTFLQSDVDTETAHAVLRTLAGEVARL